MYNNTSTTIFPKQRISESEKNEVWTRDCVNYIIGAGSSNRTSNIQSFYDTLNGVLDNEDYKRTLNPYNSEKVEFTRYPATIRNLDIISDVVRRYVGEYIKSPHEFLITATNPDIVMKKEAKIREIIMLEAQRRFAAEFDAALKAQMAEGVDQETAVSNVQQEMDFETFVEETARTYIDKYTQQADELLQVLDNYYDAATNVPVGYLDFIVCGEAYTYRDIRNGEFYKEWVRPTEMFPISNGESYIEDHDMVARKMSMSYNQILDNFGEDLSDTQLEALDVLYRQSQKTGYNVASAYNFMSIAFPYFSADRNLFERDVANYITSNASIDVWHVCWKSWLKVGVLSYIDMNTGIVSERLVEDGYTLDASTGDLDIVWTWKLHAREAYRIGDLSTAIYFNSRPLLVDRKGKLPYNGVCELLPGLGKFSVVGIMKPFQIMRNIFAYHRELLIAKNKMLLLVLPTSLLGSDDEDQERTLYRINSSGMILYDDSKDTNSLKAQQIRMVNASMNGYIKEMTDLMEATKAEARELVDMTAQRYGSIATSAGKGTTEEAIIRGSMGSVIVVDRFDKLRELDYNADLDYTKVAWVDGFNYSFFSNNDKLVNFQLNSEDHAYADYLIKVKNSSLESEKLQQLKDWAFSAAQNGDMSMALAAINSNSVPQLTRLIERFEDIKRQNEEQMKQLDAELAQLDLDKELQLIREKGVQDRLLEELKQAGSLVANGEQSNTSDALNRLRLDQEKLELDREKLRVDTLNKQKDRDLAIKIEKIKQSGKAKPSK